MSKQDKILSVIMFLVAGVGFFDGYMFGFGKGLDKAKQIMEKTECEVNYENASLSATPVRCLKYFNLDSNLKGQIK